MTIQEDLTTTNRMVRSSSDPEKKISPSSLPKDAFQHFSSPTVLDTVSSLDLTNAKKIQSDIVSSDDEISKLRVVSASRSVLKSPRTLLHERRDRIAKHKLAGRERKLSVEEILKKCPSRDKIPSHEPISLEDMSSSVLDMKKYQEMKLIKRSRSKSFNKNLLATINSALNSGHLQPIDESFIHDLVNAHVRKKVDTFLNAVNDFSLITSDDLERCCLIMADKMYKELCNKDNLYRYIYRNLLSLKVIIGSELEKSKWGGRSEWLDNLVESLEFMLSSGSFSTERFQMSQPVVDSLEFYDSFLKIHVKDSSIRSLLQKAIHPDEEIAEKTLECLSFWGTDEGYCEMVNQVRSAIQFYINHHHVQTKTTLVKECFFSGGLLENVDLSQVARSYIMHTKRNYAVLKINGRDISDSVVKGGTQIQCQEQFFQSFLSVLYEEGIQDDASDEFILQETQKFLSGKKFLGQEILLAGSNSAWAVCDGRFRKMYPLLFNEKYKTRMNQGTECFIQVESNDKFSIQVNKTYSTYPQPPGISSKDSYAIDHSRPLCGIQVCWQIDYDIKEGWSYTVSTPSVKQKKATNKEWKELLDILLAPTPVIGSSPELPINNDLQNALKFIL